MYKVYEINGRKYRFTRVYVVDGVMRGYCSKRKKWAWLFPERLLFDGEWLISAKEIIK